MDVKWEMVYESDGGEVMYRYIFSAGSCALHKPVALRGGARDSHAGTENASIQMRGAR